MPMLIIGGGEPEEKQDKAMPMKGMAAKKKFLGVGGQYDSADGEGESEDMPADSSAADIENVRLFFKAGADNPRRALEALKALVQSCMDSGTED